MRGISVVFTAAGAGETKRARNAGRVASGRVGSMHMQFIMKKGFRWWDRSNIYWSSRGKRSVQVGEMTWRFLKADVAKFMAQSFL